jgi:aspartate racemase
MRVIGLLGGMSWESTAEYYRVINQEVRRQLGRQHSAKVVMYSVDFEEIEQLQRAADWDRAGRILAAAAAAVQSGGADFLVLCTNTMHKVAPAIEAAIDIPLIHIADATADAVRGQGIERVGLLGTRFTMEEDFYKGKLAEDHGLEVMVPDTEDRAIVDRVIFDELCLGKILEGSRSEYERIIRELADRGADGVILGCTEIGLLVGSDDSALPVFDTTRIHSQKAVDRALSA